jgi:hypothetical protein
MLVKDIKYIWSIEVLTKSWKPNQETRTRIEKISRLVLSPGTEYNVFEWMRSNVGACGEA